MHEANEPQTSARITRLTAEDQSHRDMRSYGPSEEKGWPPPADRWQRSASIRLGYWIFSCCKAQKFGVRSFYRT